MKPAFPVLLLLALGLTGCASMVNSARQDVRVQTRGEDGQIVADARCTLRNVREVLESGSDSTVAVHRSDDDLHIQCQHPAHPDASARAISRANPEMAGNAFFIFGLGAILDHKLGTGYSYPGWMQLIFGQHLVFDRGDEQKGAPVPPKPADGQSEEEKDGKQAE